MTLTLEAGKDYRTTDGSRVTLYAHSNNAWPFTNKAGNEFWSNSTGASSHSFNGQCYSDRFGKQGPGQNIVEACPEEFNPMDAVKLASLYASTKRLADAAERIATALETLAGPKVAAGNAKASTWIEETVGAKPDADGWIEWHGGERPVAEDAFVDVQYRDGQNGSNSTCRADYLRWAHNYGPSDIIAYRVHRAQTP